jgi:signal transduction histidine kinase
MIWAALLWSERGLIGLLLLGEKRDGSFYSLEEIEIARASGERIADILASTELSRRLMHLQRKRLAESQVLDQQARRVLHDEVLPQIHALMLELRAQDNPSQLNSLGELHRTVSNLLRELPAQVSPHLERTGLIHALHQVVEIELKGAFDLVRWQISPEADARLQEMPSLSAEVLFYAAREALRNAARHARDEKSLKPLHLLIQVDCQDDFDIIIEDNGGRLSLDWVQENGGQGLTLHSTLMAVVGGSLSLESKHGVSTRVVLRLPEG